MVIIEKDRSIPALRFKEFSAPWGKYKLGELGEILIGLTYAPSEVVQEMEKGTTVLRSSNIKENRLDLTDLVIVKKRIPEKLYIRVGDILICTRNGSQRLIGKNVLIRYPLPDTTWGAFMAVFRSPCNDFLAVLFQTSRWYRQIHKNLGARINQITTKVLNSFEFYLPSLPEQRKIGSFFSTLDDLIENIKKQKEKLEELKKGLMQRLFPKKGERVPELRFKGFEGEWKEVRVGDVILKIIDNRGKTPPIDTRGIPLIETNAIGELNINFRKIRKYVSLSVYKSWFRSYLIKYDLLFSTVGQTALCSVFFGRRKVAIAQNVIGLRFNHNRVDPIFSYYWFMTNHNNNRIKRVQMNAVQPSIKVSELVTVKLLIPVLHEQKRIAYLLSGLDNIIKLKQQQINKLEEFKKGFLQRMFV